MSNDMSTKPAIRPTTAPAIAPPEMLDDFLVPLASLEAPLFGLPVPPVAEDDERTVVVTSITELLDPLGDEVTVETIVVSPSPLFVDADFDGFTDAVPVDSDDEDEEDVVVGEVCVVCVVRDSDREEVEVEVEVEDDEDVDVDVDVDVDLLDVPVVVVEDDDDEDDEVVGVNVDPLTSALTNIST